MESFILGVLGLGIILGSVGMVLADFILDVVKFFKSR
jgi:hypothetical protein